MLGRCTAMAIASPVTPVHRTRPSLPGIVTRPRPCCEYPAQPRLESPILWSPPSNVSTRTLGRDDQARSAYEAWNITYFPDRRVPVDSRKVLGLRMQRYHDVKGSATVRPLPSAQSDLATIHLRAVEDFRSKQKRCWLARAVRGEGKTYEQHLDEKCRKLPAEVRAAVSELLFDRGRASSTRYRTRTWTVVSLHEQLPHHRFAQVESTEVKRHKVRVWKNLVAEEPLLYKLVILGSETEASPDINTFAPFSNPWRIADNAERRRRSREQRRQRDALRHKTGEGASLRQPRGRSVSPPSYRRSRSRYGSPAPTSRSSRYESPPPYQSPRLYPNPYPPMRSYSPVSRIRVVRRRIPSLNDIPPPPTPPESYTPPPGVSAYSRPSITPPPPPPPIYGEPFHPRSPLSTSGIQHPVPRAQFTFGARPPNQFEFDPPVMPATCPAYRAVNPNPHFSPVHPCHHPITPRECTAYHLPCAACTSGNTPMYGQYADASSTSAPLVPPPPPSIPPLSTPSLSTFPSGTPPLPGTSPWQPPSGTPPPWNPLSTRLSTPALSTSQSTVPESQPETNPPTPAIELRRGGDDDGPAGLRHH